MYIFIIRRQFAIAREGVYEWVFDFDVRQEPAIVLVMNNQTAQLSKAGTGDGNLYDPSFATISTSVHNVIQNIVSTHLRMCVCCNKMFVR